MCDPTIVPETIDDLYRDYDAMIERQIVGTARKRHTRLQRPDVEDLKQNVYARVVEKEFLARSRELFGERGGGRFDASIRTFTTRCTLNMLLRESSRPSGSSVSLGDIEEDRLLLKELLRMGQAITFDSTQRQMETVEYLDRFDAWLETRWGNRVQTWCTLEDGTTLPQSMPMVFRLWREFGEHRQSTHQIARHLQMTDSRVRHAKVRIREQVPPFLASLGG
jgi:hypothetical protein